jgi:hypothetical protein
MKIICKSNFNLETVSDWLVAENVSDHMATRIANLLNSDEYIDTPNFYVAVPDDYVLYQFEP